MCVDNFKKKYTRIDLYDNNADDIDPSHLDNRPQFFDYCRRNLKQAYTIIGCWLAEFIRQGLILHIDIIMLSHFFKTRIYEA